MDGESWEGRHLVVGWGESSLYPFVPWGSPSTGLPTKVRTERFRFLRLVDPLRRGRKDRGRRVRERDEEWKEWVREGQDRTPEIVVPESRLWSFCPGLVRGGDPSTLTPGLDLFHRAGYDSPSSSRSVGDGPSPTRDLSGSSLPLLSPSGE